MSRNHVRRPTFPLAHSTRSKPRRWPLVLRFIKGAIHGAILVPVVLHALFTAVVVLIDTYAGNVGLPSTIIPSLSIVVGLMLVFRNGTSYDRFWTGRKNLASITTSVRNLTRVFLTNSSTPKEHEASKAKQADTESIVKILIAIVLAVKFHLRAEWGSIAQHAADSNSVEASAKLDFTTLLPPNLRGFEEDGLGLPLQLSVMVESYIRRGVERGWFNAPQSSQLTAQVNALTDAYSQMETIRSTPMPVAYLIHQKQVLALFNCVLPFAMVDELGWWTITIVALVSFTLYGIEGIGSQLEDPFGYDRNDIKMDAIVEDAMQETMVLLNEWKHGGSLFEPRILRDD